MIWEGGGGVNDNYFMAIMNHVIKHPSIVVSSGEFYYNISDVNV